MDGNYSDEKTTDVQNKEQLSILHKVLPIEYRNGTLCALLWSEQGANQTQIGRMSKEVDGTFPHHEKRPESAMR